MTTSEFIRSKLERNEQKVKELLIHIKMNSTDYSKCMRGKKTFTKLECYQIAYFLRLTGEEKTEFSEILERDRESYRKFTEERVNRPIHIGSYIITKSGDTLKVVPKDPQKK